MFMYSLQLTAISVFLLFLHSVDNFPQTPYPQLWKIHQWVILYFFILESIVNAHKH